jgi:hypothetical protein
MLVGGKHRLAPPRFAFSVNCINIAHEEVWQPVVEHPAADVLQAVRRRSSGHRF